MKSNKLVRRLMGDIERCYQSYKTEIKITHYQICDNGSRIIFRIRPQPGTKIDSIFERAADVQAILALPRFEPFRDREGIWIAVFGSQVEKSLVKILQSDLFRNSSKKIPLAIGYDLRGEMYIADLDKLKHLLIGGAIFTGKTTALHCLIFSIIAKHSPENVNLILFDMGIGDLEIFSGIPHLSHPIVRDEDTGIYVISSLHEELERRASLTDEEINSLPHIVCVMDEFFSFVTDVKEKNKESFAKLAGHLKKLFVHGRHKNIHMVLATQDTKVKNLDINLGFIRARIALACGESSDSVSILGEGGAEKLTGDGAMLFKSLDSTDSRNRRGPMYLQGAYISEDDEKKVIMSEAFRAMLSDEREYRNKFTIKTSTSSDTSQTPNCLPIQVLSSKRVDTAPFKNVDELRGIILWTLQQETIASDRIQKDFNMGKRANKLMDKLLKLELISPKEGNKPRKVLPRCVEDITAEAMEFFTTRGLSVEEFEAVFPVKNPGEEQAVED